MTPVERQAETYFNSDDAQERASLAKEILSHFLPRKDGKGLANLIQRLDPQFFIRALDDAARAGADVAAIAPELIGVLGTNAVAQALALSLAGGQARFVGPILARVTPGSGRA